MSGNSPDKIVLPTRLRLAIESASPPLIETGSFHDFPILQGEAMNVWFGYKGKPFSAGQLFCRYWREMVIEPNTRRNGNVRNRSTVMGCYRFSMDCEGGYVNGVHGGATATAMDEILATIAFIEIGFGRQRMPTVELKIRYKRPVPLDKIVMFYGSVVKWEGKRRLRMKAYMYSLSKDMDDSPFDLQNKKILVECEGVYHVPRDSYINGTVAYDEAIQRFGRLSANPRRAIIDYLRETPHPISKL